MSERVRIKPLDLPEFLLASGETFVRTERVAQLLGVRPARVSRCLTAVRREGRIVSITKGMWAPVEEGWRHRGAHPPAEYLDDLMAHLGHRHYVAYRSAAAVHGASHHSLPILQVAVDAYCRDRMIGGVPLRFVRSARVGRVPVRRQQYGRSARVTVSAPEVTVLDLVERPQLGGGLDYVATTLGDMQAFGLLDAGELTAVSHMYPKAVVQRVGHILDYMSRELAGMIERPLDLVPLEQALAVRGAQTVTLSCGQEAPPTRPAATAPTDRRWRVIVDYEIEHDL
ncbi:MAG: hypothetical protein OXC06_19490 [Acidimicrobiaceae bacterium]|nr:hypothetical protein [Acidimicrobiaceae bacterium]